MHPCAAVGDAAGNLHVPDGYRTTYQYLGTWAVAADKGVGPSRCIVVYASPGAVSAYRKRGHFPDRAVLVKGVPSRSVKEIHARVGEFHPVI